MNAGKGLTKSQQGNNIIMNTRREEIEKKDHQDARGRHQKMSREFVIPKELEKEFESEVNQIQILEEEQGIIFRRLLATLKIEDETPQADAIFDLAFNRTPHVKEWIKFV